MTIKEAAGLVIQAGIMAEGGDVFILDMGQPIRIYELAESVIRLMGYEPHEDIKITITGLRPGEKLYEELLLDDEIKSTRYKKIFIANPHKRSYSNLMKEIKSLKNVNDNQIIKNIIKNLVPEYSCVQAEEFDKNEAISG